MKTPKCRQRKVQTFSLILIVIILYYLLQFFTLSKLNTVPTKDHAEDDIESEDEMEEGDSIFEVGIKYHKHGQKSFNKAKTFKRTKVLSVPRGVLISDAEKYVADDNGNFKCLHVETRIPIEQVNDDYCDCLDSSDEPGTSACPLGRFYCKVQLPDQDPQFVHSSKVNDGICDCCDGSDEWLGQEVPDPMKLKGHSGAVFHTPCKDHCGDLLQLTEKEERIHKQGLLLQKRFLDAATNLHPADKPMYGPEGIFYLLSQNCFEHSAHEYHYRVCPFVSVRQDSGYTHNTILGRNGKWIQQQPGNYQLAMDQGDAALCPDGQPRQTQINFLCGLDDRVISIHEDQKCRYLIKFSSPAAC